MRLHVESDNRLDHAVLSHHLLSILLFLLLLQFKTAIPCEMWKGAKRSLLNLKYMHMGIKKVTS